MTLKCCTYLDRTRYTKHKKTLPFGLKSLLETLGEQSCMKNDLLHDNQLRTVLFQVPRPNSSRGHRRCFIYRHPLCVALTTCNRHSFSHSLQGHRIEILYGIFNVQHKVCFVYLD